MTTLFAIFIDAWEQLKLQRVRVFMSLVGVTLAVAALTVSLALGNVMQQVQEEDSRRYGGPEATYSMNIAGDGKDLPDLSHALEVFNSVTGRYQLNYSSAVIQFSPSIPTPNGHWVEGIAIEPDYFSMHGYRLNDGRMLSASDGDRLLPVALISQPLADELGGIDLIAQPEVTLTDGTTMIVVGIIGGTPSYDSKVYVLPETYLRFFAATEASEETAQSLDSAEFRFWVPEETNVEFARKIVTDMRHELGSQQVHAHRVDAGAHRFDGMDPSLITQLVLIAVSVAILTLGALSLINVAVVTVRHRIREFGIRRAFGASQRRIFIGVMMESVVGTFVAGVIGVGIVALLYRGPVGAAMAEAMSLTGLPEFPISAAVIGILTSVITGAISGAIPAVIALRSKVIDAIRF